MKKGHLETHILVLVTLGLTAFGLVMVYSATSAPAALGGGDPVFFSSARRSTRRSESFSSSSARGWTTWRCGTWRRP